MINSNKNIYIQETEVRPNKYAILVMFMTLCSVLTSWIMNELGFFRVDPTLMRVGSILSIICVIIPLLTFLVNKSLLSNPRIKYVIMTGSIIFTFVVTTLLCFHTTIMTLFPIFIAMLYRSKSLGKLALFGSMFCCVVSPIVGYLLGAWDVPLFQELILIATGGTTEIINPDYTIKLIDIGKILLYLVFPRSLMIGSCGALLFYIIGLGNDHVQNQILLNQISHNDALTGLYNQNYFKEIIASKELKGQVGIIFFDVNGLKTANDSKGHEYGDLLLKKCGESISAILEENRDYGFRVGGDEFVIISEFVNDKYVEEKIEQWKKALMIVNKQNKEENNGLVCSMAVGYAIGDSKYIDELVKEADAFMYKNKAKEKELKKEI